jgi:pimeloyl-ACP methyl ester carboxylesterase
LEHELRPEALASIAREENAEASTNTTHAAVSPKTTRASETETRAETASTGLVPPHETSTLTDRAVRTEPSVDDKSSLAIDFEGEGGFLEAPKRARPTKAPPKDQDRVRRFYGQFPTSRCVEAMVNGDDGLRALRRLRILIVHGAKDLVVRPSSARQFHRVLEGRAGGSCCLRGAAAAVAPESRASLLMLDDAAHMTIFSHPTRIAEAVDELWGGALRYEEEL